MARLAVFKKTRPDQVYDHLHRMIVQRRLAPGEQLASMKSLAAKFETSVPTVQRALDRLEAGGLVTKRQGSGTFVSPRYKPLAMSDSVVLCMDSRGHVWGDLARMLVQRLHESHRVASIVDGDHQHAVELMQRLSHAEVGCFVMHGHEYCQFDVLRDTVFDRKPIVGIVDWACPFELPNLLRVLSDHADGVRQVVDHLAGLGHRRLLVVGTQPVIDSLRPPGPTAAAQVSFLQNWPAANRTFQTFGSHTRDGEIAYDEEGLVSIFKGPDAPTAIFGFRDVEACLADRIIRKRLPHLAGKIAVVGYYNTPWSQASDPPVTSVDLDLPSITDHTLKAIDAVLASREPAQSVVYVKPVLIVRGTSVRNK